MQNNLLECRIINKDDSVSYPFATPLFQGGFTIKFNKNITFIVGENGVGKSTILEGIAQCAGFSLAGGNKNQQQLYEQMSNLLNYHSKYSLLTYEETVASGDACAVVDDTILADNMKLIWRKKTGEGFFLRAENFLALAITKFASAKVSHGEGLIQVIERAQNGLYILDEPEAGLSPVKLLELLSLLDYKIKNYDAQFIISTHSPILMAYPDCQLLLMDEDSIKEASFEDTIHYQLTKSILSHPQAFMEKYFKE